MFKNVTIKLGEAFELLNTIDRAIASVDVLPFKLGHRLNRQYTKLSETSKLVQEARIASLEGVLGKEELEKVQSETPTAKIDEILKEEQMTEFNELFARELESDFTAELLSESFEELVPDGELNKNATMALSSILLFFEERKVWDN